MKYSNILIAFAVTAMACNSSKNTPVEEEKNEVVAVEESGIPGTYGATLSDGSLQEMTVLQTSLDNSTEFSGKVKVKISDVCQMKGCWMTAELPDGRTMRITFKDYGFFVPKDASGYTAIIEGDAVKKMTDEATLKHYAEESGKPTDEISGPGEEISFVASGVVIQSE